MGREEIAKRLRDKGLIRQAVLLESRTGNVYLSTLMNKRWQKEVKAVLGKMFLNESLEAAVHGSIIRPTFQEREYEMPSLEVQVTTVFNEDVLRKAGEQYDALQRLLHPIEPIVYGAVKEAAYDHEDLLFRIFKDRDLIADIDRPDGLERARQTYYNYVESAVSVVNTSMKIGMGNFSFEQLFNRFCEYFPGSDPLSEANAQQFVEHWTQVLEDPEKFNSAFDEWLSYSKKNQKERVVKHSRKTLDTDWGSVRPDFMKDEIYCAFPEDEMPVGEDLFEELMGADLSVRQRFLDFYGYGLEHANNKIVGIQQILAGGPVTNPELDPVSCGQNHDNFPNIQYPDPVKAQLEPIAREGRAILDSLPDIEDLAAPSRLRKKRSLSYDVRELPKEPLDVTFGNDSGCCIFVPEDPEDMQNGIYVPSYLSDDGVRLFAVYREKEQTDQRMGLVIGFETQIDGTEQKVLACNSLELSRRGFAGGASTINQIVDHVESWLIRYAQEAGYSGVAMGSHEYNTSVNHSARRGDVVQRQLVYLGKLTQFYSDILVLDEKRDVLVTRPNSCYWLCKPSAL